MKKILFILVCATTVFVACNKSEKEPTMAQQEVIPGQKVTLTFDAPQINNVANASSRKVNGTIASNKAGLSFVWDEGDVLKVYAVNESNEVVGEPSTFVMTGKPSASGQQAHFDGIVPEGGCGKYKVVYGPDNIPTTQVYKYNGIAKDMMRFEVIGSLKEKLTLMPVWSVLVVNPKFYYSFPTEYTANNTVKNSIHTYLYQTALTLDQQTSDDNIQITYQFENGKQLYETLGGQTGTEAFPIIVYPTEEGEEYTLTFGVQFSNESYGEIKLDGSTTTIFEPQIKHPSTYEMVAVDTEFSMTLKVKSTDNWPLHAAEMRNITLPDICVGWGGAVIDDAIIKGN